MTDINSLTFDDLVPKESRYLAKSDVGEDGVILTIKGFKREVIKGDDGDEEKTVLHFMEDVKPMIVNRTNAQLLGIVTGAKTAGETRGKQIVVYNDATISFGSRITGGLRIKKVAGSPAAPRSAPAASPDPDDHW